jgi:acid phosphatase
VSATGVAHAADVRLDAALHDQVKQIVVINTENRSFANLYGNYAGVQSPPDAVSADRYVQLDRDGKTPPPTGVITRDLIHRSYQNQMQINAGRNNQFAHRVRLELDSAFQ